MTRSDSPLTLTARHAVQQEVDAKCRSCPSSSAAHLFKVIFNVVYGARR